MTVATPPRPLSAVAGGPTSEGPTALPAAATTAARTIRADLLSDDAVDNYIGPNAMSRYVAAREALSEYEVFSPQIGLVSDGGRMTVFVSAVIPGNLEFDSLSVTAQSAGFTVTRCSPGNGSSSYIMGAGLRYADPDSLGRCALALVEVLKITSARLPPVILEPATKPSPETRSETSQKVPSEPSPESSSGVSGALQSRTTEDKPQIPELHPKPQTQDRSITSCGATALGQFLRVVAKRD